MERRQVKTIDEAITQAKFVMDFKHERHDKAKGRDDRSSHAKGGGDHGQGKEHQEYPKQHDPYKLDSKRFGRRKYIDKRP